MTATLDVSPAGDCRNVMREMQTGEHTSELGEWRTVQRAADPRLRAYVHRYFASSSNLRMPVQERHLPIRL
jgi:hypothetical protein